MALPRGALAVGTRHGLRGHLLRSVAVGGLQRPTLTAAGVPLDVTEPGDGFHFERFILAEVGPGLAPAVEEALHVRTLVHGDPPAVTVSGRVVANGAPVDPRSGSAASLLFYEPAAGPNVDDPTRITPWNEVVPAQQRDVPGGPAAESQLPRPALRLWSAGWARRLLRGGGHRRGRSAT